MTREEKDVISRSKARMIGMTIDDSIESLVLLKKLEDSLGNISGNTNSVASQSLGCAIDTMRKYQKIEQIYQKWNEVNDFSYNQAMREIGEVMEDKSEESNGGTYSKNILQGCKRAY